MSFTRRDFLKITSSTVAGVTLWKTLGISAWSLTSDPAADRGPFQPSWESLTKYKCPEWFRDAKFGIWAHWTAQCVPEQGDWYARQMYMQGNPDYNFQVEHYGHPSKVGFKDIDRIWHAENWDPARLIALYKKAGAKYFVSLANHHDNFDCFDSTHQPWNSVAMGPKKDIVGTWEKEARKAGLRFGVTSHASHAWTWYEVAQGSDKTGPLAGVPYDGTLTKADGKGTWWDGLDPQDLYAQNHKPGRDLNWNWDPSYGGELPDKAYCEKFYNRTIEVIDKYKPDLLYFDDTILPLYQTSDVGLRIASHFYNSGAERHGGVVDGVLNGKGLDSMQRAAVVMDFERGRSADIVPQPWQTDTCIGDWHYRRSLYLNHQYKTPNQVVKMLVDIVSKNGNLLLNIPVRGDGTIDPDEEAFLHSMAAWMDVNSESIFKTRPWKISGEGPIKIRGGGFSEGGEDRLTAADFRFTTKGNTLYAAAMAWPADGTYVVRTLASTAPGLVGKIKNVEMLGAKSHLMWKQDETGLVVTVPDQQPCDHAWVLKITGLDLAKSLPVPPPDAPIPDIKADSNGAFSLTPSTANLVGDGIKVQDTPVSNIGFWDNATDTVHWKVQDLPAGCYKIAAKTSALNGGTDFMVTVGAEKPVRMTALKTDSWDTYVTAESTVVVAKSGDQNITIAPADAATWKPMNLAGVTITPTVCS